MDVDSDIFDELDHADTRVPNLFSVTEEKNKALNKKHLVHRFVYISKLRNFARNGDQVGNYYKKFFKDLQNLFQSEPITGLLLIYHQYVVHVVETSTDMILKIVQDLKKTEQDETGFLTNSRILVVSHDIPERLYGQWCYRALDIEGLQQQEPAEEVYKLVGDLLVQLVKLGVYLHRKPMLNMKDTLDNLYQQVPEFLPQLSVIQMLLSDQDQSTMAPQEFLDIYRKTFDFNLESDYTWPMDTRTFPYK